MENTKYYAAAFLCCMFFPCALHAQQGTLIGTVQDATRKSIPGATVRLLNKETGSYRRSSTDEFGFYSLPSIIPGVYDVDVSAEGFRISIRRNVDLHIATTSRVDFTLGVGTLAQTVTITDDDTDTPYGPGRLRDYATGSGGTLINKALVSALPSLGSNPYSLINLTEGSSHLSAFPDHLSERPFDNVGMDGYSINGGPSGGNNNAYFIDGAPNNSNEGLGFVPPPNAVREISIGKNLYDAEFGRTGGGITSVNLRNGTGTFHTTFQENLRNNRLNANLTQGNANGMPSAAYIWSEPSLSVDGHIPHSGGTYFLFAWDELHDKLTNSFSRIYPTSAERKGDFSHTLGANGNPISIYDPVTTDASSLRTAFAGSIIPLSRIDPVVSGLIALAPLPNVACAPRGCMNYSGAAPTSDAYDAIVTRIDRDLTVNEKLFFTVEHGNRHEYRDNPGAGLSTPIPVFPSSGTYRANNGAGINLTSVLSSKLVSTFRINMLRHNGLGIVGGGDGINPTLAGFSPRLSALFGARNIPQFNFTDSAVAYGSLNGFGTTSPGTNTTTYQTNWNISDTLNYTVARQTIKTGFVLNTTLQNNAAKPFIPGITFGDVFTRANYLQSDPNSGDAIATALLGYPTGGSYTAPFLAAYLTKYAALFVQDDWRISDAITVSLGLRWDYQSPVTERYNRAVIGFDPTAIGTIGGRSAAGGLIFADSKNPSPYRPTMGDLQPRFGIAWTPARRIVFRGGWGRSIVPGSPFPPGTGFSATTSILTSPDRTNRVPTLTGDPGNPTVGLSDNGFAQLYPNGLTPAVTGRPPLTTGAGTSVSFIDPNYRNGVIDSFNAGFDVLLPGKSVLHAEYNGSRGKQISVGSKPINSLSRDQFLSLAAAANNVVPNPFAGSLPGTSLNSATWTLGQSLLPFPQYTGINEASLPVGRLWYDSLQVRLDKRLSHGLAVLSNFTWSKNLGATDYMNPSYDAETNLRRVMTSIDQPYLFNLAVSWTAPKFFVQRGQFLHRVFDDWAIAATAQSQSGNPISAPSGVYSTGVDPTKPDAYWSGPGLQRWFNTCTITMNGGRQNCLGPDEPAAWTIQPPFTLNNLSPRFEHLRSVRAPTVSLSVSRTIRLRERLILQLRGDAYNLTNTPWYGSGDNGAGINTNASSLSFGRVTFAQGNDPRTLQLGFRLQY